MVATNEVSQALQALYTDPSPAAKEKAQEFLLAFQKTDEAWATANALLQASDAPLESRLFAAQTFRAKINFDLESLDATLRTGLRDSLLAALTAFANGSSRAVLVQLSVGLADLALQLPEWNSVVPDMIERFGKNPATVPALLQFLTVLPQEVAGNTRIRILNEEWRSEAVSNQIISTLSMYLGAEGVTDAIKNQVFACLSAWLRAGELPADSVSRSPLLDFAFQSLASETLLESSTDALCDLIHETQDLDISLPAIEQIVPRLVALKPLLEAQHEDSDRLRGYCRIFTEAGEWYTPMIVQHPETFLPIVEALALCCAYDDLEVASITFNFWYRLAPLVKRRSEDATVRPLLDIYAGLVEAIIRHLHYPNDEGLTGQEGEDFSRFRHAAGDTLKDCCHVLGTERCLQRAYDMIVQGLQRGAGESRWQDLEAPLFSMRSMGSAVDPENDAMLPLIMDIIPKLPVHPKIRYATILVLCRYTEWTNYHPDHIPFQLQYISSGFEDAADEVKLAAAQAMNFLCRDCSQHLVSYLPKLHQFVQSVGPTLAREDINEVSAAIAHIIAAMPMAEASQALWLFCSPLVESVRNTVARPSQATKAEIDQLSDELERLDTFLSIVGSFNSPLPAECEKTVGQVWLVINALLQRYGDIHRIAERTCAVIRRGLQFFGDAAYGVMVPLVERMVTSFESSGSACYIWIAGKVVGFHGEKGDLVLAEALRLAFERLSAKVVSMLQTQAPSAIPDVIDDYIHLLSTYASSLPQVLFLSPFFENAFQVALASLTLLAPQPLLATLDFIREVVGHESLDAVSRPPSTRPGDAPRGPSGFSALAGPILSTLELHGFQLCKLLLEGLLTDFPEDAVPTVITLFRLMAVRLPAPVTSWVPPIADGLPSRAASPAERAKFVSDFSAAMTQGRPDLVKNAFMGLNQASKRHRQRERIRFDER